VRFGVLGPIVIENSGVEVSIGRSQRRGLLSYLLLHRGQFVSAESIIEALWGGAEPSTARQQIQTAIHAIRTELRRLGIDNRVLAGGGGAGYLIRVPDDQLDLAEFTSLTNRAREATRSGRFGDAARDLRAGLDVWRGPPLADASGAYVESARAHLEDHRLGATEDLLGAQLALGRHDDVLAQLGPLLTAHPLRERLCGHQMLGLYRAGRRVEALEAFRGLRDRLREEQGLDPGSELRALEKAILNADPGLDHAAVRQLVAATAAPVPAQLPGVAAAFVGRVAELSRLDALLPLGGSDVPATALITIVSGMGGVGKTATAIRWAHSVRDCFPDGQLYINLHGYSSAPPVPALDALTRFLNALGVPAKEIPVETEAAASLYRTRLSDKRMLILLDNASHAEQVRLLLPGHGGCLTLVTSRNRMTGLIANDGARRLTVDVLTPDDAVRLLGRVIGDRRVRAEPEAAAALARACSYLPLALRVVAANLCEHPSRRLAEHVELLLRRDRLDGLQVMEDPDSSVRAALGHSYRALDRGVQRIFRLLSLVPGPDVTAAAVAALADVPSQEAAHRLDQLVACHLVEEQAPGRFTVHDVLRWYALELTEQEDAHDDHAAATDRLYDFYLRSVDEAAAVLYPHVVRLPGTSGPTAAEAASSDDATARAWLDAELPNLVAATRCAAEHGPHPVAWRLADSLRGYFWISRRMTEWLATAEAGLRAAAGQDDPRAHAALHLSLGVAHRSLAHHPRSVAEFESSLEHSRRAGWLEAEACVLGSLAIAHAELCQQDRAIGRLTEALALNRRIGRRAGEAVVLGNLGNLRLRIGELRQAESDTTEALAIYREIRSPGGEAIMLTNLGLLCVRLGRFAEALLHLGQGVALHERIGDRYGQPLALAALGELHLEMGSPEFAAEHIDAALALSRETGDRDCEATALALAADLSRIRGAHHQAMDEYRVAVRASLDAANGFAEIQALVGMARCLISLRRPRAAADYAREACSTAANRGFQTLEGQALTVAGEAACALGDDAKAQAHVEEAVAMHRMTGCRTSEARALVVFGQVHAAAGRIERAVSSWTEAQAIMVDVGAADAGDVRAMLADVGAVDGPGG
jgi:DNA-binding SARP family transcriptional activator/tetratricopeptide (TPR) repeat protein